LGRAISHGEKEPKASDGYQADAVEQGLNAALLTMSEVLFDETHAAGILGYSAVCASFCGAGGVVILE
jgi:hypothetical protein